ncbi:hypothetical protein GCM10010437_051920 [Actinoplanes palleronii]
MPAQMCLSLLGRAVRVRIARSRAATAHLGAVAARTTRPRTATAPEPDRPRTPAAPPAPSADSCRPLSADRGPLPPHRTRPRTPAAPSVPTADPGRPTGPERGLLPPLSAERGPLPPHRCRARTSTAPPASITHADRYDNTGRLDIPARNDTPTHLHPNTSGTTPRPQGPTEIKIG